MTDTGRRNFVQATLEDNLVETSSDLGDEGEEENLDSCSSFSLQQCIDEFRARRIRRNSVHVSEQRDEPHQHVEKNTVKAAAPNDDDLISQNRSNKEHERQCKPCKNGFCYCFTSDSGDGGCGGNKPASNLTTARGVASNLRNARRTRKSESGQVSARLEPVIGTQQSRERRSAPASIKTTATALTSRETLKQFTPKKLSFRQTATAKRPLTAVSRLETTTHDAPLIHIVQELRDNCVISEVRVNQHKLQARKEHTVQKNHVKNKSKLVEENKKTKLPTATKVEVKNSPKTIETLSGDSIPVARLEVTTKSPGRKPGAGRLLQKRLSHSNVQYKPRDFNEPPPKPPRASTGSQALSTDSSLTSISPSIREAERIVNEFLIQKGIPLPKILPEAKIFGKKFKKRLSFPLAHAEEQMHVPTCPSLSDIERTVDVEKPAKTNNKQAQKVEEKIEDIQFGWKEPKVSEMLNYDNNGNRKEFKSQAAQAEPQSIGWQIPPKLSLDTVDGAVCHNLASNLATKDTPTKRQFSKKRSTKQQKSNQKFVWSWAAAAPKCPRTFLRQSKKKILKLVTPKKDNREQHKKFQARKTPYRNIGIQTSLQDLASAKEISTQVPLSPPGSYHSAAVQTSNDVTPQYSTTTTSQNNNNTSDSLQFDFTRKVSSPPRKSTIAPRSSQRKLDFPSNVCGANTVFCFNQTSAAESAPSFGSVHRQTAASRTYRSYQTDFDQDVNISKMGFILSNIRARLEASDEHAIRTFEEIERREQHQQHLTGFDCPDSHGIRRRTEIVENQANRLNYKRSSLTEQHEPIYSEIEEDSIHVTESPVFDNKTGIESSSSAGAIVTTELNFEALYAKVNKPSTKVMPNSKINDNDNENGNYTPLGKFLHDSLRKKQEQRLSIVMEPSVSDDVSYSSPPLETSSQQTRYDSPTPSALSHCESLNNIRVMEQHSPPKRNRNLSKSDLSLHRSEIFLENLCRSELIVEDGTLERLEKVDNQLSNLTRNAALDSDAISYDVPVELPNEAIATSATTSKQKPQKFSTKPTAVYTNVGQFSTRLPTISKTKSLHSTNNELKSTKATQSKSCPVTPQKCYNNTTTRNASLIETNSQPNRLNVSNYDLLNTTTQSTTEPLTSSAFTRYKRIKQALQKSFRKSKNFVKYRRASLPAALTTSATNTTTTVVNIIETTATPPAIQHEPPPPQSTNMATSCLNLEELFQFDETTSVAEQIVRAVSICRQLPELETSREMVEAERLLLYSTLQREICKLKTNVDLGMKVEASLERHFTIQSLRLPVIVEANLKSYFNYYFTITFECNGQIYSTQSTEYRSGELVFQNCDFEFKLQRAVETEAIEEPCINCNIFMLRLRKVSATKPTADESNDMLQPHDITPLPSTPLSSTSSSSECISSRFRLYAAFSLNADCFKPYKFSNNNESDNQNTTTEQKFLTLSALNHCRVPLRFTSPPSTPIDNSLTNSIAIIGKAVANFPTFSYEGFLHVQDPFSLHNWNWRWCTLSGLKLQIWCDATSLSVAPLMSLDLSNKVQQTLPLIACSRELCARARSFCLQCSTSKIDVEIATAAVFFAADNDNDLNQWLKHLNEALNFIAEWLQ